MGKACMDLTEDDYNIHTKALQHIEAIFIKSSKKRAMSSKPHNCADLPNNWLSN